MAAMGLFLIAAVTLVAWWAGDMSSRGKGHNLIIAEKKRTQNSGPVQPYTRFSATGMAIAPALSPSFPEVYFQKPEDQGCEQLASVSLVIELEHFRPKFPSYTLGGKIDKVYVVGDPQTANMDITYDNGIAFRASISASRPDFARSIWSAKQEGHLTPEEIPYLVGISDTIGLMWPRAYNFWMERTTAPVLTWWESGVTYDVTTGKYDFNGNDSVALSELKKIAESFSGHTRVPTAKERISIPPTYTDFKTAEKATGFKFRIPSYTAGGVVTDVYKRINDGYTDYDYSNRLMISVDTGGKKNRPTVTTYNSYEEAVAAYQKGSVDIDYLGVEAVPVNIAGNRGILIVRKDRRIYTPPDNTGMGPTQVLPSLLWWEGKNTYSLLIDDEKAFKPDIEAGIQEMLKIARSMYQ